MKQNITYFFLVVITIVYITTGCCNLGKQKKSSKSDTIMVTKSTTVVMCDDTANILWTATSSVPCPPLPEKVTGKRPYLFDLNKLNKQNWSKIKGLRINGYQFVCNKYVLKNKLQEITYTYTSVSQADCNIMRRIDIKSKVTCLDIKDRKMFYYFMAFLERIYGCGNVYAINQYGKPISRNKAFCVIWDIGNYQELKLQIYLQPIGDDWYINKTKISVKYKGFPWHERKVFYD